MRTPQTLHKEDPESLWLVDPLLLLIFSLLFHSILDSCFKESKKMNRIELRTHKKEHRGPLSNVPPKNHIGYLFPSFSPQDRKSGILLSSRMRRKP